MKQDHHTEVLVAGAGPVGMLAALLLGEKGVQTQIIDQESRTAAHSYACALHPHPLKLLDQAGVAKDAINLGWMIDSVGFYEGDTMHARLSLSELAADFPFVLVLPQSKLEEFLEKLLRQLPNVQFHWGRRLQDLEMNGDEVIATVDQLKVAGVGYISPRLELCVEKQLRIHAPFVIGADGHDSIVRQRLGIKPQRVGTPERFAVFEFETDADAGHEMKIVLNQNSASVMWPLAEHRCRWSFQILPTAAADGFPDKDRTLYVLEEAHRPGDSMHQLQQLLRQRAPWFKGAVKRLEWTTHIQFDHWAAEQFGRGRCWLAGDAAHQTGPVGMQSVNMGFTEAVDLARLVERVLRHGVPMSLLNSYERHHRGLWQKLLRLNGTLKFQTNATPWVKENAARICACLPASGQELTQLLALLGVELV